MASLKELFAKKKQEKKLKHADIEMLAEKHLHTGKLQLQQKNYDLALESFNQAITLTPNRANVYAVRGFYYTERECYELALVDYNKALKLDPDFYQAYAARGQCYFKQKNHELALIDFNKAIILNPSYSNAYTNRGTCYLFQEEYDYALNDFNEVIRLDPKNAIAYFSRGFCYEKQENYLFAIKDFDQAIKLDPSNALAYSNRGNCYMAKEDYTLALENYDKATQLAPDCIEAYAYRGFCYEQQKNYELALKNYNEAIRLNPNDHLAYFNRGSCYVELHNYELASNDFAQSIEYLDSLEDKKETCLLVSSIFSVADQYVFAIVYVELAFTFADSKEQQHKDTYVQNIKKQVRLDRTNKELEEKNKQLEEKEKELEDMMSMFAHKFRSPLDAIIYNTQHDNQVALYTEAAQTMRGLLNIFSIISTDTDILKDKIKQDSQGTGNLVTVFSKTLEMILLHLLSVSGAEKIQQHYLSYAKAQSKCDTQVNYKTWCEEYFELEQTMQADWEASYAELLKQSPTLEQRLAWLEQYFFKLELIGFDRTDIQFKEYGTTESLLTILLNEILVNVFKYYSSESKQAVVLEWVEREGCQVLICCNPSIRSERTIIKGSHKGHAFLSTLARKTGSLFNKPIPQDNFVLEFGIPNELLISK